METSRSFVFSSCSCPVPALTLHQTNILICGERRARIGGLGAVLVQPSTSTADVDRFSHGAVPEAAADLQGWDVSDAGVSKESDVYAFGVLAWEASIKFLYPIGWATDLTARYSLAKFHSTTKESLQPLILCLLVVDHQNQLTPNSPTVCGI